MSYDVHEPPTGDWLQSAAAVSVLSFDVDAETPILAENSRYAEDLSTMSHQAYGPRVGVPRIIELLAEFDVEATFFVPGMTAERWPGAVEKIVDAGHEVALHGYDHRRLPGMSLDDQQYDLEAGLIRNPVDHLRITNEGWEKTAAPDRIISGPSAPVIRSAIGHSSSGFRIKALADLGVAPYGYRAPYWQITRITLDLLASYGIRYDSSLMDSDTPYTLSTESGLVAELPVHWSLDDWEQYAFLPELDIGQQIESPTKVVDLWCGELDAMRDTNSLCVLACHPFLSGRPSRIRAIRKFVEFALHCGDVRFSRADRLAELVLQSTD